MVGWIFQLHELQVLLAVDDPSPLSREKRGAKYPPSITSHKEH